MHTPCSIRPRRGPAALAAALAAAALVLAGCASTTSAASGADHPPPAMSGMARGADGVGLSQVSTGGYRFVPASSSVPAGQPAAYRFRILGPDGAPVTAYETDQTKLLHLYVIRADLTGFQHVHPTLAADGTWTAPLAALTPGRYRVYPQFTALPTGGTAVPMVLGAPLTAAGPSSPAVPLPAASSSTQVDGYTLTLAGHVGVGTEAELTITVTRNGQPVTDLEPYLDTYAHLTAFHLGDLAFAHLHPTGAVDGDHGGPQLSFHAELPEPGSYRLFLQFRTAGVLHTATLTLIAA